MSLDEVLAGLGADDWLADGDDLLICPHGSTIELDGRCPDGCVSPLISAGLI